MTVDLLARAAANPANVLVVAACLYETAAITTGKVPPISTMCRQHRWIEVLFLGGLAVHLHDEVVRTAAAARRNR